MTIPAISAGPFTATPIGLHIRGKPSFEVWFEYGRGLRRVEGALQWVIGDWLNYGSGSWGEKWSQATMLWPDSREGSLSAYKSVAARVAKPTRVGELTWSHHRLVAYLPEPEQRRWLQEAIENEWHTRELAVALQREKEKPQEWQEWLSAARAECRKLGDSALAPNTIQAAARMFLNQSE